MYVYDRQERPYPFQITRERIDGRVTGIVDASRAELEDSISESVRTRVVGRFTRLAHDSLVR